MHSIDTKPTEKVIPIVVAGILFLIAIVMGGGGGFLFGKKTSSSQENTAKPVSVETSKAAGIIDKKTFKDNSTGVLREGGMDGEGNFHLERPGGISQNVYLTSSTVDLSKYVGKKVRVWGQTFQGNKAGWLMDVGLVEIL